MAICQESREWKGNDGGGTPLHHCCRAHVLHVDVPCSIPGISRLVWECILLENNTDNTEPVEPMSWLTGVVQHWHPVSWSIFVTCVQSSIPQSLAVPPSLVWDLAQWISFKTNLMINGARFVRAIIFQTCKDEWSKGTRFRLPLSSVSPMCVFNVSGVWSVCYK